MDLIKFLPMIYNLIDRPMTRYEILKKMGLPPNTKRNYDKIDECIAMGFLKRKDENSQTFVANRKAIFEFWTKTPIGKVIVKMIDDWVIEPIV